LQIKPATTKCNNKKFANVYNLLKKVKPALTKHLKINKIQCTRTKLFLISILTFAVATVFAQSTASVKGRLIGEGVPVEFANVLLTTPADTTAILNYAITDSTGLFVMDKVAFGEYRITYRLIGYKTIGRTFAASASSVDLGTIEMEMDAAMLGEITVTAQRKLIQKTTEGFVINAAENITQTGGTATDILRSAPTVHVSDEGGISLRGKTPLILINGRSSSLANTNQIAASSIESIEIITNPSARYDASAESGIINIILKKNRLSGTNGSFALGAGWGARERVNVMANINHKTDKWNFGIAYDNRFAMRTRDIESSRTNFALPDEYKIEQIRHDNCYELLHNLKLNIDFLPDSKNTFAFEATGNLTGVDNLESLNSAIRRQNNDLASNRNRYSEEIERSPVAEFVLNYDRKYADDRKKLSANVTSSIRSFRQNTDITSHMLDPNDTFTGAPFYERTHNYENVYRSNAAVDYVVPVSPGAVVEVGAKGQFRRLTADFQLSKKTGNNYEVNDKASDIFEFNEQVYAAYIQYNGFMGDRSSPHWQYGAGIRAEQVYNHGDMQKSSANSFKNNYINLFPSANLAYFMSSGEFLKLTYGKRINYPGAGQLRPFTDVTDSLHQYSGNPYLKPEIIHSTELGYHREWKKYSLSSILFYRYAQDIIRQYSDLQPNGMIMSTQQNFGSAVTYGLENILDAELFAFYSINLSMSLFQSRINGTIGNTTDISNNAFCLYGKLINNFKWGRSRLQFTGIYNSPTVTPQGKNFANYYADIGFQQQLGKNAHLGIVLTDIFNSMKSGFDQNTPDFYRTNTRKADTRAILVTFAYTFNSSFRSRLLENRFSIE
jgi:outer membrane receptor for ferrienterochelin and colicin